MSPSDDYPAVVVRKHTHLQFPGKNDGLRRFYDKLHACLKHYAVHSGLEYERHHFDVSDIPMRDFRETYLYAFEDIIKHTDVQEVMCAYNSVFGAARC